MKIKKEVIGMLGYPWIISLGAAIVDLAPFWTIYIVVPLTITGCLGWLYYWILRDYRK